MDLLSISRKLTELGVAQSAARVDIEAVRDRVHQAESDLQGLRSDHAAMHDRQELLQRAVQKLDKHVKEQDMWVLAGLCVCVLDISLDQSGGPSQIMIIRRNISL
jgi:hypothetical protein